VSEVTVRRHVRVLRAELESNLGQVTIITCHPPGAEAEVDFGEATVILAGSPTAAHVFHLRLSCSAKAAHLPFLAEDQLAFLDGHVRTFERLGGVPARIRYDNLTAAVSRVLQGRDRTESERFTLPRPARLEACSWRQAIPTHLLRTRGSTRQRFRQFSRLNDGAHGGSCSPGLVVLRPAPVRTQEVERCPAA
jgi:transposase